MERKRFAVYAWSTLVYNLGVILWGAYVRASGSGAGCGSHWPLCNGEVIPRAQAIETIVELTHRVTSGLALVSVLVMLVWVGRAYPAGHRVRRGAVWSLVFMVMEALLGAGLVLFELVAHNESLARVVSMSAHLVNTFMLVAALTLTAWWASGAAPIRLQRSALGLAGLAGLLGTLLIGVTGAVIALGDTLFFAHVNAGGSEQSVSPFVESLKQIRIVHPIVAVLIGVYLIALAWQVRAHRPGATSARLAYLLTALVLVQFVAGVFNVYLKVPIAMQLLHLFLADLVWIAVVLVNATVFAMPEHAAEAAPERTSLQNAPSAP
ncbi:MAG TPA: COX15/CtaA family protein [Roseiflexaceae bacterium]|nr:COX15/CtaA family protein [Roseiflexaceae bacterium]